MKAVKKEEGDEVDDVDGYLWMQFVEYMASELYLRDLDLIRTVPQNYSIEDGGTPDDIDDTLFAATGEPALYTSGTVMGQMDAGRLWVMQC